LVAAYYGGIGSLWPRLVNLPVAGIHLDLVRGDAPWDRQGQERAPDFKGSRLDGKFISVGVVDGRNVWRTDPDTALERLRAAARWAGRDRLWVAPSCPLLHVPWDVRQEARMDAEIQSWLAFAVQKLEELATFRQALDEGEGSVRERLAEARAALTARRSHAGVVRPEVRVRVEEVARQARARAPRPERKRLQQEALRLPPWPTTTIGSFPQTPAVRAARADVRRGRMTKAAYEQFMRAEISRCIRLQEELGLDVLVHGEFERTDMVEYFAQQLEGCLTTDFGWVQSYGTRCVKPPILYGDISRPRPMTVDWAVFAQSLTAKPVKGMLTGPVTLLQWSFVRDDQPRADTCRQLAVAVRDEVLDLERAGLRVIQIDEPALREGLPLRRSDRDAYLTWAVDCFRLAYAGVRDGTQIHSHMCYAEFADVLDAIDRMDVDVISLEAARSRMDSIDAFRARPNPPAYDVGPGVYDIHSPRIPSVDEMVGFLEQAAAVLPGDHLWVNPDCGLKTRREEDVLPALRNMVAAARRMREARPQPSAWSEPHTDL
ncbi:MAG: 5-methyltetrahydropteroyltriglutamate--homocysteine S-methyltransferase, partial [Alicyclobacillus sp.]|nr:5-methyltetrahydropteroyltriglutamate--homocysteine S-methyltransferase [Alicyclobacillus sp.]